MADDLTSETTFQEMLTAILDTLIERRQVATDAATARFEDTAELNVRFIGLSQIGGVHCHVAEIAWVLKERIKAIDYKGIG